MKHIRVILEEWVELFLERLRSAGPAAAVAFGGYIQGHTGCSRPVSGTVRVIRISIRVIAFILHSYKVGRLVHRDYKFTKVNKKYVIKDSYLL